MTIDPFNDAKLRKNLEDTLVRKYLEKKVSLFEQTRKDLGVGENVGLGLYENDPFRFGWHYYDLATIKGVKVKNNKWYVKSSNIIGNLISLFFPILIEDECIIIPPSGPKNLFLVSFYPRQGVYENGRLETKLFEASDGIFCGISSHELAEYFLFFDKKSISNQFKQILWSIRASNDQVMEQIKADVLASLLGYREQILAYLNFHLECVNTYGDYPFDGNLKSRYSVIQELDERIRLVKEYA